MKKTTPVSEIMSKYIISITPNTNILEAKSLFEKNNVHHLPVLENGKLLGMLSKTDVFHVTHCDTLFRSKRDQEFNERLLKSILAEEIMTRELDVLSPHDTVVTAATHFSKNKYHALPVVDKGEFVGIVTTYDLVEYAYCDHLIPILM